MTYRKKYLEAEKSKMASFGILGVLNVLSALGTLGILETCELKKRTNELK
jgi:hypothetical protein